MTDVTFNLTGFSELERPLAYIATSMIANLFFPNGNYPPLRSNVISIVRNPVAPVPRYAADVPFELIMVNCAENRPWQYTYQVAHEFGHLSTRADQRHPRQDGNMWIEEAICGAYSICAIRAMSETPRSRRVREPSRVWRVCPVCNNPDEFHMMQCLRATMGACAVTLDPVAVLGIVKDVAIAILSTVRGCRSICC
jgi:hypothetical protein